MNRVYRDVAHQLGRNAAELAAVSLSIEGPSAAMAEHVVASVREALERSLRQKVERNAVLPMLGVAIAAYRQRLTEMQTESAADLRPIDPDRVVM